MRKIKRVLLVDDDTITNKLNTMVLEKSGVVEHIDIAKNGEEALEFLKKPMVDESFPRPELILLDINMPVMNGWEFLEAYKTMPEEYQGGIVIMMLTSSLNKTDELKSKNYKIDKFIKKPLTVDKFLSIVEEAFPND